MGRRETSATTTQSWRIQHKRHNRSLSGHLQGDLGQRGSAARSEKGKGPESITGRAYGARVTLRGAAGGSRWMVTDSVYAVKQIDQSYYAI